LVDAVSLSVWWTLLLTSELQFYLWHVQVVDCPTIILLFGKYEWFLGPAPMLIATLPFLTWLGPLLNAAPPFLHLDENSLNAVLLFFIFLG
jgi:hypothetical protein